MKKNKILYHHIILNNNLRKMLEAFIERQFKVGFPAKISPFSRKNFFATISLHFRMTFAHEKGKKFRERNNAKNLGKNARISRKKLKLCKKNTRKFREKYRISQNKCKILAKKLRKFIKKTEF